MGCPDCALVSPPAHPLSACTCDPDCCRLEVRPSLKKELSAGAAGRGAWGCWGCRQGAAPAKAQSRRAG